jgi:hypothetical protein
MAKIRLGFVSNSSSSSFVIVASENNHKNVLKEFSEYERAVIEANISKGFFMLKPIVSCGYMSVMDSGHDWEEPETEAEQPDNYDGHYETMERYFGLLGKNEDEVFTAGYDG